MPEIPPNAPQGAAGTMQLVGEDWHHLFTHRGGHSQVNNCFFSTNNADRKEKKNVYI